MSKNISNLSGRVGLKDNLFKKMSENVLNNSPKDIKEIAKEYNLGVSTIHGAESFYEFLRPSHREKKAFVCNGSACMCAGTQEPLKKKLKEKLGDDKVVLGLSGGVDSTVAGVLLNKAIGKNLYCIFVDNGLLRKGEFESVLEQYKGMGLNVKGVDAKSRFYEVLDGISEPEAKRKAIGNKFIDVFDDEAHLIEDVKWLAQGTIYPDVIESSGSESKEARVIKSHHNVGGLPEEMKMNLVEPLRDLFKDEVRRMGVELGLAPEMLNRHPFPGPGLGVRILGDITKEKTTVLKEADHIFIEELIKADLYKTVSQAFAVYLPIKSVGVVGDERRYAEVIGLRAVETVDFMTARWAHLPYDFLEHVSNRIVNEIEEVSRVVYDISSKPPATIEWE